MDVQEMVTVNHKRPETGAMRMVDDWNGLFIRGDDCIYLKYILENILAKRELTYIEDKFIFSILKTIDKDVLINTKIDP